MAPGRRQVGDINKGDEDRSAIEEAVAVRTFTSGLVLAVSAAAQLAETKKLPMAG